MNYLNLKQIVLTVSLVASLGSTFSLSAQTLAQEPLLSKTVAVRPNLTFILDESLSMDWDCIYKQNSQNSFSPYRYGIAYSCLSDTYQTDTAPTLSNTDMRYASPENNQLMYDPRKYYTTGFSETGAPNPNSNAAWTSPGLSNGSVSISGSNHTGRAMYIAKSSFNVGTSTSASSLKNASNYNTYWIFNSGSYFGYKAAGDTTTTRNTTNYLPKPVGRTDCVANATRCTYTEELQNLRNWYTYHRTRLLAAKTGISIAFTGLPDSFRMNYATLGEITRSAMSVSKSNLGQPNNYYPITPLRSLNNYSNNINAFRKWLTDLTTYDSVGTPLRQSLDIIGKSYQSTSNNGPWGNTPWSPGNETASSHVSCRRNFAILTTDGQWNDGVSPIGSYNIANSSNDTDGTNGPLISYTDPGTGATASYRFKKQDNGANADRRNVGKSDKISGAGYTNTLADVALNYWSRDLRSDLVNNVTDGKPTSPPFWQNLTTYSVGFGVYGTLTDAQINSAKAGTSNWSQPVANSSSAIDDLRHAAHNAGGGYISVSDAQQFATSLRDLLLNITGETSSQAGVAASTTALQNGTKKYVPYYVTGEWWGNLKSLNLDVQNANETGLAWEVVTTNAEGKPTGATTIPSHTTRNVIVSTQGSLVKGVNFNYIAASTAGLIATTSTPVSNKLINTFSTDQFNYIRGDRSNEGTGLNFRKRFALLGDIVNSRPSFVKNNTDPNSLYFKLPSSQGGGIAYTNYKQTKSNRTEGVLFLGANDGMLHGFKESDGKEVLAFIPRSVLGNLHLLTDINYPLNHRFYVDGPTKEADAYINAPSLSGSGTTTRWTNLLLGSTGAGAKAVFALDVSKPLTMEGKHVMWEVSNLSTGFSELGHVLSDVETGVTPSGDWIAAFGNGYSSASGRASLFLVNLSTGAKIRELTAGTETSNGLGGVRLVRNENSEVIGAYAGDLKGNVWRFDLSGSSSSSWKNGELLFKAQITTGTPQPITAAPAVFARNDGKPGYIVVVGTGRMLTVSDTVLTPTPSTQSAYGLWDESPFGSVATISAITGRSVLVGTTTTLDTTGYYNVANARPINWATDKGWYLDYTLLLGQRSIYPITPLNTIVSIETIAPKPITNSCSVNGEIKGINYFVNPYTGACKSMIQTLDTNGDNAVNSSDSYACSAASSGDGSDTYIGTAGSSTAGSGGSGGSPTDPCWKYDISSTGEPMLVNTCNPPEVPSAGNGVYKRDMRQIFIRK